MSEVSAEAVAAQRRAAGVKLQVIAGTLDGISPYAVRGGVTIEPHLQYLTNEERAVLNKVASHIEACEKVLLRMSNKLRELA